MGFWLFWTFDGGFWTLDGGFWTLDGGFWTLDGGFWTSDGKSSGGVDLACKSDILIVILLISFCSLISSKDNSPVLKGIFFNTEIILENLGYYFRFWIR